MEFFPPLAFTVSKWPHGRVELIGIKRAENSNAELCDSKIENQKVKFEA